MPHKHCLSDSGPPEGLLDGAVLDGEVLNDQGVADFLSGVYCSVLTGLFSHGFLREEIVEDIPKSVVCSFGDEEFDHFGVSCFHGDFEG